MGNNVLWSKLFFFNFLKLVQAIINRKIKSAFHKLDRDL